MAVNLALGKRHVELYFAIICRQKLVLKLITWNLSAIYPFIEIPVELAIMLKVHFLCNVLFNNSFERLSRGGHTGMACDKIVHHVDESLVFVLRVVHH